MRSPTAYGRRRRSPRVSIERGWRERTAAPMPDSVYKMILPTSTPATKAIASALTGFCLTYSAAAS